MELVPVFIILSVLVYHVSCTENQTESGGETLEDEWENGSYVHQGIKFKSKKIKPFLKPRVIKPVLRNGSSNGMGTTEMIFTIVGVVLLVVVIYAIQYGCRKFLKKDTSREEQSNVTMHPPPSMNDEYMSPPERSNGEENPSFPTFPEQSETLDITNDAMSRESVDLPPSYSEVVTKDFNKMYGDKSSSVMAPITERPPPDYDYISVQKY